LHRCFNTHLAVHCILDKNLTQGQQTIFKDVLFVNLPSIFVSHFEITSKLLPGSWGTSHNTGKTETRHGSAP